MFATLAVERDPLTLGDILPGFFLWVEVVGGFTAFAVLLWLLIGLPRYRRADWAAFPKWQVPLFVLSYGASLLLYLVGLPLAAFSSVTVKGVDVGAALLTAAGACALVAGWTPFFVGLTRLRFGRVWALAKLSFKEALRRRVLYAFSALILVILFGSWFVPYKSEDQVRNYVYLVYFVMGALLVAASLILASFSLPADIRLQTIHTVVTKPVERFEIVLGRFLGFAGLMSIILLVMTGVSLIYVLRGVNPDAAAESLKARVPVYGDLSFEGTTAADKGESVGREWDYRSYISGPMPGQSSQFAVWSLKDLPGGLGDRRAIRCEYTFDIYRTTKGEENRGVSAAFVFQTWHFDAARLNEYRQKRNAERNKPAGSRRPDAEIDDQLAEEFGYYEIPSTKVEDYHTQGLEIPAGLFRSAAKPLDDARKRYLEQRGVKPVPLQARVKCNSPTQYIGMAKYDFYLRQDDPHAGNETLLFSWNFLKGAVGLWCVMCLVIGLSVALSTYLSGVISLICAFLLVVVLGYTQGFIKEVAFGQANGPVDSFFRLVGREPIAAPREDSAANRVATVSDAAFRWGVRRFLDVIPDVDRFNFIEYVQEGFNVSGVQLFMAVLVLGGYLLPWMVLAYYLIKWREVAGNY